MKQSIKIRLTKLAIVFTLLLGYGLTMSCSSNDENGDSSLGELYFRTSFGNVNFEVDNSNKEQLDGSFGVITLPVTYYGGNIIAKTTTPSGASRLFSIAFYDDEPIGTQTYSGFQETQSGVFYGVIFIYQDLDELTLYMTNVSDADSSITFTTINNTIIKGTFSGTLLSETGDEVVITNGEFQVERKN